MNIRYWWGTYCIYSMCDGRVAFLHLRVFRVGLGIRLYRDLSLSYKNYIMLVKTRGACG